MCWDVPPPRLVAGWLNWNMPTETNGKSMRDSQLCNQNCTIQLQFSVTAVPTWLPGGQWQVVTGMWGGTKLDGGEDMSRERDFKGSKYYRVSWIVVLRSRIVFLLHQFPPASPHSISELSLTCWFHSTICSTFWWALFCMETWAQSWSCCFYPLHAQQLSIVTASCEIWCKLAAHQLVCGGLCLLVALWGGCGKSVH